MMMSVATSRRVLAALLLVFPATLAFVQPTPRWLGASGAAAARVHYPPPLVAPLAAGDASSSAEDWGAKLTTGLTKLSDLVDETVVIKYGGHAMGSAEARASFARDVALLQDAGVRCVVVHGGGPMISAMLEKMGVKGEFSPEGLRITDEATVEIAEMVLCGSLNKRTVHEISMAGGSAIGLSGKDDALLRATQLDPALGLVGEVSEVNVDVLEDLLDLNLVPVIAPIGIGVGDDEGTTYNINADTAAGAVAKAMGASRLLLLTDIKGVLDKEKNLLRTLTPTQFEALKADGTITAGMVPKVQNAVDAVNGGVGSAVILDGRTEHAVLIDLLGDDDTGTAVMGDEP